MCHLWCKILTPAITAAISFREHTQQCRERAVSAAAFAEQQQQRCRAASSRAARCEKRGALVRDVIADALCGPNGYFATRLPVLASHTALPFREMKGRADYERALRERYAERAGFLTPAEIFAPWYSHAAARWALAWHRVDAVKAARAAVRKNSPPLRVAEFGVGSGAHAVNFWITCGRPRRTCSRTVATRASTRPRTPAQTSKARVRDAHGAVASAVVADARSEWTLPAGFQDENCPTVVFALELLDNLPHDKVRDGFEGWVVDGREDFRPAADAWVRRALELDPVAGDAFVPTGCLQFLARVFEGAPRPRLFLADFSELPRPTGRDSTAANAPLVAAADRDLDSYLEARGDADIFFATDFDWLSRAYAAAGGVGAVAAVPPASVGGTSSRVPRTWRRRQRRGRDL